MQAVSDLRSWIGQLKKRMQVLIVDDEPQVIEVMTNMLSKYHCDIQGCTRGEDAITKAILNDYDIIFVDLKMFPVSGIQVIEEVRKVKPDSRFVVITGYAHEDITRAATEAGAIVVIPKPIRPQDLDLILDSFKC